MTVVERGEARAVDGADLFPADGEFVEVVLETRRIAGWVLVDRSEPIEVCGAPVAILPVDQAVPVWVGWVAPDQVHLAESDRPVPRYWGRWTAVLGASLKECRGDHARAVQPERAPRPDVQRDRRRVFDVAIEAEMTATVTFDLEVGAECRHAAASMVDRAAVLREMREWNYEGLSVGTWATKGAVEADR